MNFRKPGGRPVLLLAVWLSGVVAACGSSTDVEILDAEAAGKTLDDLGVVIPAVFEFGQMSKYGTFQGKPSYGARYDGPVSAFADSNALATANPEYSPLEPLSCTDTMLLSGSWGSLGFSCTDQMLTTQHPPNSPIDTVTLVLTSDGTRAHLFIRAEGN